MDYSKDVVAAQQGLADIQYLNPVLGSAFIPSVESAYIALQSVNATISSDRGYDLAIWNCKSGGVNVLVQWAISSYYSGKP